MAVVALAIAGTDRSTVPPAARPAPAEAEAAQPADAAKADAVAVVIASTVRFLPKREHGTDGLMGRLPFGIPGDTPLVRAERRDKFIIDDVVRRSPAAWLGGVMTQRVR